MIEDFYGFQLAPFRLMPDPRFFFPSDTHSRALAFLEYGLEQGEGHIVLTGDVGVGKSMVIAYLLGRIDRQQMDVVSLSTSNLSPVDALRRVASLLGDTSPAIDKGSLLDSIELRLHDLARARRRAVILVDEAQCMPIATLDELRMLANLEVAGQFPLQCFFVGQSEFLVALSRPELAPLRQRLIAAHHVEPLRLAELSGYVEHRLQVAGWQGRPVLDPDLFPQLHLASQGVPRQINALLGRLLLLGALERRDRLDAEALTIVLTDLSRESLGVAKACELAHASSSADPVALDAARLATLEVRVTELEEALLEVISAARSILPVYELHSPAPMSNGAAKS